ncbi:MAG: hypothetical protein HFH23_14505 [Ruminococcus sp.]|nr:hypothetical protein [Ruminococcus sp.]
MMTTMNMDFEACMAMMEVSSRLLDKIAAYFKENHQQILQALASVNAMNGGYVPAYAM